MDPRPSSDGDRDVGCLWAHSTRFLLPAALASPSVRSARGGGGLSWGWPPPGSRWVTWASPVSQGQGRSLPGTWMWLLAHVLLLGPGLPAPRTRIHHHGLPTVWLLAEIRFGAWAMPKRARAGSPCSHRGPRPRGGTRWLRAGRQQPGRAGPASQDTAPCPGSEEGLWVGPPPLTYHLDLY